MTIATTITYATKKAKMIDPQGIDVARPHLGAKGVSSPPHAEGKGPPTERRGVSPHGRPSSAPTEKTLRNKGRPLQRRDEEGPIIFQQ